ncbi:MAG: exosporium protein D [Bacillota bacterium]|uniref:exosporium protein D n=1 Tax=Bacillus sp. RO2 TaxID=2723913 RepID=UPI00145E069A|nr:exosporium protein D [Bacillus sp. RO2]MEA3319897.1 exosporium protein D [Bacillota bacterium]NMH71709.1 exosporium protein D [Bacillus sp. RO2]
MKKQSHIESHFVQGSGLNQTGNIPLLFPLRPNETEIIFSDETNNHNKTLIQIKSIGVGPFPPFPLQVFIFTKDSLFPIIAEVQGSELFNEGNTRAFQVENFSFLAIRFNDEVGQREAAAEVFIQKTFCIGCGDR